MTGVESVVGRAVSSPPARIEHDFLGQRPIPAGAYWGVHTARALENFTASGTPVSVHPTLVAGLGAVKLAAVRANRELGLVDARCAAVIERACQEVRDGLLDDQFVVDVLQGGAGTSTNMNANEVIANRALELLGLPASSVWTSSTDVSCATPRRGRSAAAKPRSRRLLVTTNTDENAIAAPASIGLSRPEAASGSAATF